MGVACPGRTASPDVGPVSHSRFRPPCYRETPTIGEKLTIAVGAESGETGDAIDPPHALDGVRAWEGAGFDFAHAARGIQANLAGVRAQAADGLEVQTLIEHAHRLPTFARGADTLRAAGLTSWWSGGDGTEVPSSTVRRRRTRR